jgi:hypothetical protein
MALRCRERAPSTTSKAAIDRLIDGIAHQTVGAVQLRPSLSAKARRLCAAQFLTCCAEYMQPTHCRGLAHSGTDTTIIMIQ